MTRQDLSGPSISGCCDDAAPSTWRGNCFRRAVILREEEGGGQAPSTHFPQKSMSGERRKLIVLTCKRRSQLCLRGEPWHTHPMGDGVLYLSDSSLGNLIVINCYLLTGSALAFLSCVINIVACMMHVSILSPICPSLPSLHSWPLAGGSRPPPPPTPSWLVGWGSGPGFFSGA